jgi:hypothetical protein
MRAIVTSAALVLLLWAATPAIVYAHGSVGGVVFEMALFYGAVVLVVGIFRRAARARAETARRELEALVPNHSGTIVHRVRKVISNDRESTIEIGLEPWGLYFPLPPGQSLELVGEGRVPGTFDEKTGDGSLAIYMWNGGSSLRVFSEGKLIHDLK